MKIITYSDKYREATIKLIFDILEDELGRHSKSGRPDLYNIPQVYQKNKGNFWIAVDDKRVVGTVGLSDHGRQRGYLERMYVDKEYRRKGLGKKLLSYLLKFAKSNGYKKIFLSTWEGMVAANNFYIKNGFLKIKYLPQGFSHSSSDNVFYKLKL